MKKCYVEGCEKPAHRMGLCGMHYARKLKYGDVHFTKRTPWGAAKDFLAKAYLQETDDCIIWPYGKTTAGYGRFQMDGVELYAHRSMAGMAHGEPFEGAQAAHTCGNPSCINKRHLYWATPSQNSADKLKHGTEQRGEKHGQAVLNEQQVKDIYAAKGRISQRKLGERYGVNQATVSDIHTGRTWSWLTGKS